MGNQSNLILDPDLDSYYTMSLLVLRYPDLLEIINNIGVRVHTRVPAGRVESNEARTRYLILEGQLDSTLKGLSSDYGEAIAAHPSLRAAKLSPSRRSIPCWPRPTSIDALRATWSKTARTLLRWPRSMWRSAP